MPCKNKKRKGRGKKIKYVKMGGVQGSTGKKLRVRQRRGDRGADKRALLAAKDSYTEKYHEKMGTRRDAWGNFIHTFKKPRFTPQQTPGAAQTYGDGRIAPPPARFNPPNIMDMPI